MDFAVSHELQSTLLAESKGHSVSRQRKSLRYATTTLDRFLLMTTIILLPLEDHLPAVAGFSVLFILFGVLGLYNVLFRLRALRTVSSHPVFLTSYLIVILCALIETVHPNPNYSELSRFGFMIAGAVLIASFCRDQRALRIAMYGYVIASIWLSTLLFLTSYGFLQGASADDYNKASRVRTEAAKEISLSVNLNNVAMYTAQGSVVALALALPSRSFMWRNLLSAASLFCLIATFLPMSRGGIAVVIISSLAVLLLGRTKPLRMLFLAVILGIGALIWVPKVVFSRMDVPAGSRTRVYAAAFDHLNEYALTGVGAGNFWESWGYINGFRGPSGSGVLGAHNGFVQITLYWGLIGFLGLCALIWQAYYCLPTRQGRENDLALCLVGIAIALLLVLFFVHSFYEKWYSLGLGLLVGARCWVWQQGRILPKRAQHPALSQGFSPPFTRPVGIRR